MIYVVYQKDPECFFIDAYSDTDDLTRAVQSGQYKHINITIMKEVPSEMYRLLGLDSSDGGLYPRGN